MVGEMESENLLQSDGRASKVQDGTPRTRILVTAMLCLSHFSCVGGTHLMRINNV